MEIINYIGSLSLAIASYLAWKKYQDRGFLWLSIIGFVSFALRAINSSFKKYFDLGAMENVIRSGLSLVILIVLLLFVIKVAIRWTKK